MKSYTTLPDFLSDIPTLDKIRIELSVDLVESVNAAQMIGEGILDDTQVMQDWLDFIQLVRTLIITNESFILLLEKDGTPSPLDSKTPQSKYFYIGVKDANGNLAGKVVVDFRLSMHDSTHASAAGGAKYEADALKDIQKDHPNYEYVEPEGIIVNKKRFKSYTHAKFAVIGKLAKIAEDYGAETLPTLDE